MPSALPRLKPGWILLVLFVVYAVVATVLLQGARAQLRELRLVQAVAEASLPPPPLAPPGLWFPVPGAHLPPDDAHLPGAPRAYRGGVSQGFDFYGSEVGVPIEYGSAVIAAADATVQRVDHEYRDPPPEEWAALLAEVADGATAAELDRLRGRQVWLTGDDGRSYRYAHLARVDEQLSVGDRVHRGRVIGAAGNSGTDDGVRGANDGVRVHFEIWDGETYFGAGLEPAAVRAEAATMFTGP